MLGIPRKIRQFLTEVKMPGRYVGHEWNSVEKDLSAIRYRVALCYPDTYEIGMSHLGLAVLYDRVNALDGFYAERCFAPWPDMAEAMRLREIPLFSLETGTALDQFDMIGFSLQHELLYTNVLYMLHLAGLPLRSADRGDEDPIIVAGGTGALTPEPMADVVDLFLPGEGEEALPRLLFLFHDLKKQGVTRAQKLREAAVQMPTVYVPAFYREQRSAAGEFLGLKRMHPDIPDRIAQNIVHDFGNLPIPLKPVQPGIRCVHDRITLEIMRGCTRGCRFCQAGMTRRPMRTRTPETLLAAAREIYAATGYDEISLCSLSSSDYPELDRLVEIMNAHFKPLKVGLSLPSLRVRDNLRIMPGITSEVRKAGLTLAPEAATERLRKKINKDISDHDLEAGVLNAYELGWNRVKLYFMIGLPEETDEDVRAIALLAEKVSLLRRRINKGPARVTVSVSTFVPKAHTPFQWCAMCTPEEIRHKHRILLETRMPRQIQFNFHNRQMSFIEGLLARGDRSMYPVIETAFKEGACFDAWSDKFDFRVWERAIEAHGVDADQLLFRERENGRAFPWDHIDCGPSRDFLRKEYERSLQNKTTEYCAEKGCRHCGMNPEACAHRKKSANGKAQEEGKFSFDDPESCM
ncbi:MAG: TIGR03960 family B12-binding radical SAM protein [Planctomycetota bacterium]